MLNFYKKKEYELCWSNEHIIIMQNKTRKLILNTDGFKSPQLDLIEVEKGMWEEIHFAIAYLQREMIGYRISIQNRGICISHPETASSEFPYKASLLSNVTCPYVLQRQNLTCDRLVIAIKGTFHIQDMVISLCIHKFFNNTFNGTINLEEQFLLRVKGIQTL